jgi:multidrug efflux pump subunit AcrB
MVLSKEKVAALLSIPLDTIKTEGWAVSMKLRDPGAIARVKGGSRSEMSIHGTARKIPVGERNGAVVKALVDLTVDEISIVDQGASGNEDAHPKIVIAKRHEPKPDGKGLGARFMSQVKKLFGKVDPMNLDEILAKLTEEERAVILASIEAAKKQAQPVDAPKPPPAPAPVEDEEKVMKSLPESVRKRLEEAQAAKEEVAKIRKELDERTEREEVTKFKAKAAKLPFLAGKSTEEIAKTLRAAAKSLPAAEYETIEKMLENANEAVKGSPLFRDAGARGVESEMTAQGKIEAIAKTLRESDPKLTQEQAVSKALSENKDLNAQRVAELYGENK